MNILENKEIINILSIKYQKSTEEIKEILEHNFKCIRECMEMPTMPNILLHGLGRFKVRKKTLDRKFLILRMYLEKSEENYQNINWDNIKNMLEVYERIIEEENKPMGAAATDIKNIIKNLNNE